MSNLYLPPSFKMPSRTEPSEKFHGEDSTIPIYEAVGRALSAWEHTESVWARAFQLFCESPSLAAVRSYGTIESVASKHYLLRYAALEFFAKRDSADATSVNALLKVHQKASEYRNQIAHGMAVQPYHGFGYFLCPPSYATKSWKTRPPHPHREWALGADYFYRAKDIDLFATHCEKILESLMSLIWDLNSKYKIIEVGNFHP